MEGEPKGEILIYQSEEGSTKIEVRLENEHVWLTQAQLVELYQSSKSNISEHIKHIFEEGELNEELVVRKFRTTTKHGAMILIKNSMYIAKWIYPCFNQKIFSLHLWYK
jgi:hypothetical protein